MTIQEIIKQLEEIKEDKQTIFNEIADLYDRIEEGDIEQWEILEKLENIQQYEK